MLNAWLFRTGHWHWPTRLFSWGIGIYWICILFSIAGAVAAREAVLLDAGIPERLAGLIIGITTLIPWIVSLLIVRASDSVMDGAGTAAKTASQGVTMGDVRWTRVLLVGLGVFVLSFVLTAAVITGYAFKLAFEAQGAPDQDAINAFAERVGPWVGGLSAALLSFFGAWWTASRVRPNGRINGLLVGAVVALLSTAMSLVGGGATIMSLLVGAGLPLGLAFIGGKLGDRS